MTSALSVTLIVCLVASGIPVAAQEPSPIAPTISRQVGRLVAPATSSSVQKASTAASPDWSRVRKLEPGAEVMLTVEGSMPVGGLVPPSKRYFVLASDSELTVLNLTNPLLPVTATRALRKMASHHPERLAAAQKRHVFVENGVRVGPDAVFMADQKVADLNEVVQTIARTDIIDIEAVHKMSTAAKIVMGSAIGVTVFLMVLVQLIPRT
jgi:hypothetical protein